MIKAQVLNAIRREGLIAVLRGANAGHLSRLAGEVHSAGVMLLEATLTTPGALNAIPQLAERAGAIAGAGSVIDAQSARQCLAAGARFIVTPGIRLDVIDVCREQDVTVICGALTPTEVLEAWEAGADFVKVFPAGALGGPAYIRSLRAPLPQIPLIATGGVTLANAAAYLEAGALALGVGSELTSAAAARGYLEAVRASRATTTSPS